LGREVKELLVEVTCIVAGLILAVGVLPHIPGVGKSLEKVAKWLGGFQAIAGVIAIIIGVWRLDVRLWGIMGLPGIVAIVAGLVLAMGVLPYIPAIGKSLEKAAKWLGGFQTIIGIIAIIIGIGALL
jgi:hypothetical protein